MPFLRFLLAFFYRFIRKKKKPIRRKIRRKSRKQGLTPFDVLRARVDDLGPLLYHRAGWKDPWLNIIDPIHYPTGAGRGRKAFKIGRRIPKDFATPRRKRKLTWNTSLYP